MKYTDNTYLEKTLLYFSNLDEEELKKVSLLVVAVRGIKFMFMMDDNTCQIDISKTPEDLYCLKAKVTELTSDVVTNSDYSSGNQRTVTTEVFIKRPVKDLRILSEETFNKINSNISKVLEYYHPTSASFKRFMHFFEIDLTKVYN